MNQDRYLLINSLVFLSASRELLEKYPRVNLYLDRDKSGLLATSKALGWSEKYIDQSLLYDGFKDLNDFHLTSKKLF
jgi:hypothetical protein